MKVTGAPSQSAALLCPQKDAERKGNRNGECERGQEPVETQTNVTDEFRIFEGIPEAAEAPAEDRAECPILK